MTLIDAVQATMLTYDRETRSGTCVLDDGVELTVRPGALDGSGLRHLRPGQRVTITTTTARDGTPVVDSVRIVGISG